MILQIKTQFAITDTKLYQLKIIQDYYSNWNQALKEQLIGIINQKYYDCKGFLKP